MPSLRRVLVVTAVLGLTIGTVPASAGSPGHLRHERHRAAQHAQHLDARAHQQAARVAAARAELERLSGRADVALAQLQRASLAADRAADASVVAQRELNAARTRTAAAHQKLDDLAAGAYRAQAAGGDLGTTLTLARTGDPRTVIDGLQLLDRVSAQETSVIDELRVAEAQQLRAEHLAAAALARATATERSARAAKVRADTLVRRQRAQVDHVARLLERTRTAAETAHAREQRLADRIARARARAAAIRAAQARRAAHPTGPIPTCNGGSVSGYANGELPVSALCALWGAPGQMLRADAAAAFNRMSRAYADQFGVPLCVTSSYRTYQRQVELYASMPAGYAAVPGTSNHGWGLAVDLCGGIQVDGSPEHVWLLAHASQFSWFHPSWALPGGPGPHEPWHWEYAG